MYTPLCTGDLLSPPDLDRLLVLPSGCGEQNMVRFSLNLITGLYLMHTHQLSEYQSVKIRNNLRTGKDSIMFCKCTCTVCMHIFTL